MAQQGSTQPLREALFRRVRNAMGYSSRRAAVYAWTNGVFRVSVIILAALASAGGATIASLKEAQPYLSLAVVIVTGVDTWLQQAQRRKRGVARRYQQECLLTVSKGIKAFHCKR